MHVKGPVPPVKVNAKEVTVWPGEANAARFATVNGCEENV